MNISTNLIKQVGTGYTYSIHSTPLNYCEKLMSAGSRSGKVVFKGDELHVKTECSFYSINELRHYTMSSLEAIYLYLESHIILIDCINNQMTLDSESEDFVSKILTIIHSDDKNINEVWQDLVERMVVT